jgi:hypothetical protein
MARQSKTEYEGMLLPCVRKWDSIPMKGVSISGIGI